MNKKEITPKEFEQLKLKERYFYIPFYAKYKKVRKKSYCEECGNFTGYYYEERGIGEPTRGLLMPKMIDTILKPNVLINNKPSFSVEPKKDE